MCNNGMKAEEFYGAPDAPGLLAGFKIDPEAMPVLQAAATAFLRAAGAGDIFYPQIELVLEEMFTNIVHHGHFPGRRETIQVTFGIEGQFLALTVRFRGIPFDIERLRKYAESAPADMMDNDARGLGLLLIKQFSDKIEYRNLDGEGQEIYFLRKIFASDAVLSDADGEEEAADQCLKTSETRLRPMFSGEAAEVSKLAYFAYDYTYPYGNHAFYDPENIRTLNKERRLISYVLENKEKGIVGHFAISPDGQSSLFELCAGFVDPRFRGRGSMNAMAEHGIVEAQKMGAKGVFTVAVTTHIYSQKAALHMSMREAALFVSEAPSITMRAIREKQAPRESLFFMARLFDEESRGPYYPPFHHRDIIERICRNLNVAAMK